MKKEYDFSKGVRGKYYAAYRKKTAATKRKKSLMSKSQSGTKSLRELYIQGLKEMEEISLELEKAYHPLEEEVHRALPE